MQHLSFLLFRYRYIAVSGKIFVPDIEKEQGKFPVSLRVIMPSYGIIMKHLIINISVLIFFKVEQPCIIFLFILSAYFPYRIIIRVGKSGADSRSCKDSKLYFEKGLEEIIVISMVVIIVI